MIASKIFFFLFGFSLFPFSLWAQVSPLHSPEARYEMTEYDSDGKLWKRVLISEGKQPATAWQFWSLIEYAPGDDSILPTILFKKKMTLSGDPNDVQSILDLYPHESNKGLILAVTDKPLWPLKKNRWDPSDEDLYGKWIQKNASKNFLKGSGVLADCADYALVLRWIFAYEHGLPAAQTLAGSGKLFGSWKSTTAWDALPTGADWRHDERFKRALKYLFDSTYTHSLRHDLYPVAINRQFVRAGTIYLTLANTSGHTRTIVTLGSDARCKIKPCILVLWGDEPSSEAGFISDCDPYYVSEAQGGFMRFRWPELVDGKWSLRSKNLMPGYSQEQYLWNSTNYFVNFNSNLSLWASAEDQADDMAQSFMNTVAARKPAVDMGFYLCSVVPCDPQSDLFETHSTPVRDANIANYINSVVGFMQFHGEDSAIAKRMKSRLGSAVFYRGNSLIYLDLLSKENWAKLSSDPTHDFSLRWDLKYARSRPKIRIMARVLHGNWEDRISTVKSALDRCFQNGSDGPLICNPQDPKIIELGTERLDQAFRVQKKMLKDLIHAQSQSDYNTIKTDLQKLNTHFNGQSVWDLIMLDPTIDKMSSKPTDTYKQRFGLN